MLPAERDELHRGIFSGEPDLERLSFHELDRLEYLGEKLSAAWPYCEGNFWDVTLFELFTTLDDAEARDYLNLCRWTRGDERPAEHPPIADSNIQTRRALKRAYLPDNPLHDAQRIVSEGAGR
ncbi:MAG: hypothetical protein HY221_00965 [Candidatus Sungbacteria bacterium]|uniref:Uncharacterized protein n=1 Tax=Candidatus Sungiibacteriota bacterium TaxID=2750080 RepID=A0A932R1C2_9BACT|nr:hypothetical protein [Candidatus Sungbacteria bacterium]